MAGIAYAFPFLFTVLGPHLTRPALRVPVSLVIIAMDPFSLFPFGPSGTSSTVVAFKPTLTYQGSSAPSPDIVWDLSFPSFTLVPDGSTEVVADRFDAVRSGRVHALVHLIQTAVIL
ncbi:hypothetical protein CCMSSC00406_0010347 [Pleurotus cornucopiae]|uniref:Uncharacterized protein n=1 Tax=Pleurotus cornucopiae TaxID=5321 RepID=A0ACB7IRX4_PLECO|nr:hypothetical protein CCMSSC00406_0010347 [Pleurotus cornucopiae]